MEVLENRISYRQRTHLLKAQDVRAPVTDLLKHGGPPVGWADENDKSKQEFLIPSGKKLP